MIERASGSGGVFARKSEPPATYYLTQLEAAELLRISGRTLERHRVSGTGPVFVKLGRRVVYRAHDLAAWAEAHTHRSTSEFTAG